MNGVSHTGAVSKGIIKWCVKNRVYQKRRNVKGDLLFEALRMKMRRERVQIVELDKRLFLALFYEDLIPIAIGTVSFCIKTERK